MKRPEPSCPTLPKVSGHGESTVPGIYLAGEIAGTLLIKLGPNQGVDVVEQIPEELDEPSGVDQGRLNLLIVVAGSAGDVVQMGCQMTSSDLLISGDRSATPWNCASHCNAMPCA